VLRDDQKCTLKRRIRRELFGAGKKPGIDFRVNGTLIPIAGPAV